MASKFLVMLVLVGALFGTFYLVSQNQNPETKATDEGVEIDMFPKYATFGQVEIPTQVWINRDKKVAFARVKLNFNPTIFQIKGNPSDQAIKVNPKVLGMQFSGTTIGEANQTGEIVAFAGVKPGEVLPQGSFEFGSLVFLVVDDEPETGRTRISFDSSGSEIVAKDGHVLPISSTSQMSISSDSVKATPASLGLSVSTGAKANGKAQVMASWQPINEPGFKYFVAKVKKLDDPNFSKVAYSDGNTSRTFTLDLDPGRYSVVLRAVFEGKKILRDSARFTVQ